MQDAERTIICFEQRCYFSHEFTYLEHGKTLSSWSTIHKLDPILDDGILRVGGRINKNAMPMHQKNQIILPKHAHISNLILQHIHHQVGHSGRSHMLSRLGQKFLLPQANSLARKIIRKCVFCMRIQARPGEQKMAGHPDDCIQTYLLLVMLALTTLVPFKWRGATLRWNAGAVTFTCLVSRAIHPEMALMHVLHFPVGLFSKYGW